VSEKVFRPGALGLASTALLILVLRVVVFASAGARALLGPFSAEQLPVELQLFLRSICFELAACFLLALLLRVVGPRAAIPVRLAVAALLLVNVVGTVTFLVLQTYAQGFQLVALTWRETLRVAGAYLTPWSVAGLLAALLSAALWARPGPPAASSRPFVLAGVLALLAGKGAFDLLAHPSAFPAVAHSPVTLALLRTLPDSPELPRGEAHPEDWARPEALAPQWQGLASVPRDFNLVVVALESVRAEAWFPSPTAVDLPRVRALEPQSATFTRAYAHEPLTVKGLEAMMLGIYPAPFWETVAGKWNDVPLESVASRWRALGLSTAFLSHGQIPLIGEPATLKRLGFDEVLAPEGTPGGFDDRALVRTFGEFLDRHRGGRFGTVLWPGAAHLPYALVPPERNRHPANTFAAYRDAVASLDEVVGSVVDALKERNLFEKTVVVLVADHGESFGEHPDSGLAHGDRLYELNTHIPLMLVNPVLFHGERDDRLVQQKDLAATLTFLAGAESPHLNASSSIFLQRPSETAYLMNHLDVASIRAGLVRGTLKYAYVGASGAFPPEERLFDLAADPGELHDLSAERPEEVHALRARFFGWLDFWNHRWLSLAAQPTSPDRARTEAVLLQP